MNQNIGIILGFRLKDDGTMTNVLKGRLEKAIKFYRSKKISKILLSGGIANSRSKISESKVMSDYLVSHGIPKSSILIEDKSLDTFGNAIYSKSIVRKLKAKKCFVFTSDYHLRRSKIIFGKIFGNICELEFVGCGGWTPSIIAYVVSGREKNFSRATEIMMQNLKTGDHKSISKRIFEMHPFYNKNVSKIFNLPDAEIAKKFGMKTKGIAEIRKLLQMYVR
jgi:hypothetical protein